MCKTLTSAFTAPGTNAANTSRDRQSTVQKGARDSFNEINPLLQDQSRFATQIGPLWQRSAWNSINATNPWGVQTSVDGFRRGAASDALAQFPMLQQILSSGGTSGIGAMQGAKLGLLNDANSRANEMAAYWASPAGKQALAQMSMQATGNAMSIPSLNQAGQLANIIYGRPAVQVGPNPLGQMVSMGAQLYGAGAFGGGGSMIPGLMGMGGNASNSGALPSPVRPI